jgi:hypothetical protein
MSLSTPIDIKCISFIKLYRYTMQQKFFRGVDVQNFTRNVWEGGEGEVCTLHSLALINQLESSLRDCLPAPQSIHK